MSRFVLTALVQMAVLILPHVAHAGQPEAREAARMNNCAPKKIEVYQQQLGSAGQTVYRVQCTLPKAVAAADADAAPPADTLLIGCDQNLCRVMRSMAAEKK